MAKNPRTFRILRLVMHLALVAGFLSACVTSAPLAHQERVPLDVSLVQLLANPERYDGKQVLVKGFACLETEGNALYLHEEDFEHALMRNAVWLQVTDSMMTAGMNRRYVNLVGVFDSHKHGHGGMYSGTIRDISAFRIWPSREEIMKMGTVTDITPEE